MNLSTYLQMPPVPTTTPGTSNPAAQGAAALAGQAAGTSLGFDFAQVMAKQMVRFSPQQRQDFAAPAPASPARDTHATARTDSHNDQNLSSSHTDDARDEQEDDATTASRTDRKPSPRRTAKAAPAPTEQADPLAAAMTQIAAVISGNDQRTTVPQEVHAVNVTSNTLAQTAATATSTVNTEAVATEADTLSQVASQLRAIELSPRVRIITDPQQAPNPESLAAFAKSMGLDDNAIQSLMSQSPAASLPTLPTGLSATNALAGNVTAAAMSGNVTPDGLQALTSATLQNAQISLAATTPMVVSPPVTAELAQTGVLPAMSQADMANIQQLQVTVLPAASVLPNTGNLIGTTQAEAELPTDSLTLLGSDLLEQDIAELSSAFTDSGADAGAGSQSGESGHSGFGFAQALPSLSSADKAGLAKTENIQTAANMSEVYDQLSEKLSTEMAARIHKQLSDGEWKMKFGLRPENLGGVEIQLEMKDGKLDAVFRADNPLTRDLLQNSSQRLRDQLENFGIQAGLVHIGQDGSGAQHRQSGQSTNPSQVGHNSPTQVNHGEDEASDASQTLRNKANASLLDLYA